MAQEANEQSLVGQTVDITFNTAEDIAGASNRLVVNLIDGMLVCRAQDGALEWFPLAGIRGIVVQHSRAGAQSAR